MITTEKAVVCAIDYPSPVCDSRDISRLVVLTAIESKLS